MTNQQSNALEPMLRDSKLGLSFHNLSKINEDSQTDLEKHHSFIKSQRKDMMMTQSIHAPKSKFQNVDLKTISNFNRTESKFVNLDFLDWLQNKQIQTGVLFNDNRQNSKNIVKQYRKQPGPGQYDTTKYSDFFKQSEVSSKGESLTRQNFFGTSPKLDMPDYLKSAGIGDSVSESIGPGTYNP